MLYLNSLPKDGLCEGLGQSKWLRQNFNVMFYVEIIKEGNKTNTAHPELDRL